MGRSSPIRPVPSQRTGRVSRDSVRFSQGQRALRAAATTRSVYTAPMLRPVDTVVRVTRPRLDASPVVRPTAAAVTAATGTARAAVVFLSAALCAGCRYESISEAYRADPQVRYVAGVIGGAAAGAAIVRIIWILKNRQEADPDRLTIVDRMAEWLDAKKLGAAVDNAKKALRQASASGAPAIGETLHSVLQKTYIEEYSGLKAEAYCVSGFAMWQGGDLQTAHMNFEFAAAYDSTLDRVATLLAAATSKDRAGPGHFLTSGSITLLC
ncbi:MAG: hypothetical protein HYV02_08600 [Deltaproteobacteria bacterium]|nr:hypothetical protein [Deltaproteobacteria bacterium]